jgi:hypothetical protein
MSENQSESETKPKRGRKPIYANDEERHDAKLRQTIESNKRKKQEKVDFLNRISPEQKVIIKDLSENIILNNEHCRYIMALLFKKSKDSLFKDSLNDSFHLLLTLLQFLQLLHLFV